MVRRLLLSMFRSASFPQERDIAIGPRWKTSRVFRSLSAALLGFILEWSPSAVLAGGNCLLHPDAFRLQSDTVHWSIKIASGAECIQGLRWSTIMIEDISIVDQPKLGRLQLQGPSFRYFSNPGAQGTDSFKLSISGTSLRLKGTSWIEVDVTVHDPSNLR
jgi:hypothetical protein